MHRVRVRRQQGGHVVRGRSVIVPDGVKDCGGPPHVLPILVGLHREVDDARRDHRRGGADGGLRIQQKLVLEADVTDLGLLAKNRAGRTQCHLTVGRSRKDSGIANLVIAQPRLRRSADLGLPHVPFRLLLQAHMLPQQRMN